MKKWQKAVSVVLFAILAGYAYYAFKPVKEHQVYTEPVQTVQVQPPMPEPPKSEDLLRLINEERAKVGVAPLISHPNVQRSAQLKADDMADRYYYNHTVKGTNEILTSEMKQLLFPLCISMSENIAEVTSTKDAVDGWMKSKSHREAILDPKYKLTGFGIAKSYTYYKAIQHFCVQ